MSRFVERDAEHDQNTTRNAVGPLKVCKCALVVCMGVAGSGKRRFVQRKQEDTPNTNGNVIDPLNTVS